MNSVLDVLGKIVDLLGFPVFLILICLPIFLKKKRILLLLLVSLLWRMAFVISSSRYCAVYVLYSIFFLTLLLSADSKHNKKKLLSLFVVLIILASNAVKLFSNENKRAIIDCRETLALSNSKHNDFFLITKKESYRVSGFENYYSTRREINDDKDLDETQRLLNLYKYWGDREYLVIYNNDHNQVKDYTGEMSIVKLSSHLSDRRAKKFLNTYVLQRNKNYRKYRTLDKEYIVNGDMEKIEPSEKTQLKLKKWINNGFPVGKSIILPVHQNLLETWTVFPSNDYPTINLTSETPINGVYSLSVSFAKNSHMLYFMNKVPPVSGILSFRIKNISHESTLYLMRYEYSGDVLKKTDNNTYALHVQNCEKNISIIYPSATGDVDSCLFCINGSGVEFVIDDISFKEIEYLD